MQFKLCSCTEFIPNLVRLLFLESNAFGVLNTGPVSSNSHVNVLRFFRLSREVVEHVVADE